MEDKSFSKAGNADNDASNLSGSPGPMSSTHLDGLSFILESMDLNQIFNSGFSPIELLQSDDPSSVDSNFLRSTAVSKLLIWKSDILKSVEMTESEIDALENELKALKSGSGSSRTFPAVSSSLPVEGKGKPFEEQGTVLNVIVRPAPLQIVPSGDTMTDKTLCSSGAIEGAHTEVKDEDIDSPGTATSKFVESPSLVKTASPSDVVLQAECSGNLNITRSTKMEGSGPNVEETGVSTCEGGSRLLVESKNDAPFSGDMVVFDEEDQLRNLILSSNKDWANRASEVFNKLLPQNQCQSDTSGAINFSCRQNDLLIKQKFAVIKRFQKFREKVVTLKFRVLQNQWKEDMRSLSIKKYRAKSQKKFELSSRTSHCGYQKHRTSVRSRLSSPAGNLSFVPTMETINYAGKMLSESQVKLCRNILKMPALILDEKEKRVSRFISSNGLVEDPCAVEKERTLINPWTAEEKEIFMDKLAIFGKDFKKISSFLDHKTTADCVEFYYKNHKSESFDKTKKQLEFRKQGKSVSANTYLVTSGKKWNREMNAASLDMLGAASVMAAHADDDMENLQTCSGKFLFGAHYDYMAPHGDNGVLELSSSYDIARNERETAAADVLAGICGSLSSEAMSSCITSSIDPGEGYRELKSQKVGSGVKRPLTPDVTQNIDEETCSDESCGEMDPTDWTDEEKCIFIQAVSSYGKDFAMISRCVRTRSRDQCKVFFSKARKCLGLDLINPVPNVGTPETDDANGGGSDTEDAFVVEAGSVICSNKSGSKMEEDSMLINPDEPEFSGVKSLQTDLNRSDMNNRMGKVDEKDEETVTNLVSDECHQLEKTEQAFGDINSLNGADSKSLTSHVEKKEHWIKMEIDQVSLSGVDATADLLDQSNGLAQAEDLTGRKELLFPETSLNVKREENNDAEATGLTSLKCTVNDAELKGNALHQVSNSTSGPRFIFNSGYQRQVSSHLDNHKPGTFSLLPESSCLAEDTLPKDSSVIQYEKILDEGISSPVVSKETKDMHKSSCVDGYHQHLSGNSLIKNNSVNAELSQKFGVYPLHTPPKEGMNGDLGCKNPSTSERLSKFDRDIESSHSLVRDCYLQKCNGLKDHSSGTELPLLSQGVEQTSNQTRAVHGRSLSDTEKPNRNGDFKLFGQILSHPSSLQKPNSCSNENDEKGAQLPKLSSKSVNLKFTSHQGIDGNLAPSKVDRNNYLSIENLPVSYGFWDGNRIQTGYSSLPDSAILLAKYPAAFSNYSIPSSTKMEQQSLQAVVKGNERSLNGLSVFPARDMSSSNGVADYHQVFRAQDCSKLQPYTVDMKQRQDLFSEIQRRNGFESVSNLQAPGRGMVGMNVVGRGGGILVGGACSPAVSDPVAAIKMHYAKTTDQFGVQGGSIIRDDESWRGNGDIGR